MLAVGRGGVGWVVVGGGGGSEGSGKELSGCSLETSEDGAFESFG